MSEVVRNGKAIWVEWEEPGDRFRVKNGGGPIHWHEFVAWITKCDPDGLPEYQARCVSGICNRRR